MSLLIGYNNSKLHVGPKGHLENPSRVSETVPYLKKKFDKKYFMKNVEIDTKLAIEMMLEVHSKEHIKSIQNNDKGDIYCRGCSNKLINDRLEEFKDTDETVCKRCKGDLTIYNVFNMLDLDTYICENSFEIICE